METVYAAILLHKTGQEINEENLSKVLKAANANVEDVKIKALVAALEGVDIEEAMNQAVATAATAVAAPAPEAETKTEEAKKEEEKKEEEEEASAGLGALFG
ncbi:MAG: 50S ribosomal protein P1 [Candidatus Odinarchaeia archaeon]